MAVSGSVGPAGHSIPFGISDGRPGMGGESSRRSRGTLVSAVPPSFGGTRLLYTYYRLKDGDALENVARFCLPSWCGSRCVNG